MKFRRWSSELSRKTQLARYVLKWKEMSALEPGLKVGKVIYVGLVKDTVFQMFSITNIKTIVSSHVLP